MEPIPKGILITGCNSVQFSLAHKTLPGIQYWCSLNDWKLDFHVCPDDFPRHPYYWKWAVAAEVVTDAPLVMWLDVDVILRNPERELVKPEGCKIAFSQDFNGPCCGAWLADGGEWLRDFARTILLMGSKAIDYRGQDQEAVKYLSCWPGLHGVFGALPLEIVSNQDVDIATVKPLFHHLWSNQGLYFAVQRAEKLRFTTPLDFVPADSLMIAQ
jgi:hypothetical protein